MDILCVGVCLLEFIITKSCSFAGIKIYSMIAIFINAKEK